MSNLKGKTTAIDPKTERSKRSPKNVGSGDLKVCSDNEKVTNRHRRSSHVNTGTVAMKPPTAMRKSTASQFISTGVLSGEPMSVVSKGPNRSNLCKVKVSTDNKENAMRKSDFCVASRMGRKALGDLSNVRKYQPRIRLGDSCNKKKDQASENNFAPGHGKAQNGKILPQTHKFSANKSVMDTKAASRKPVGTSRTLTQMGAKTRTSSKFKQALALEKKTFSTAVNASKNKQSEVGVIPKDIESVIPCGCFLEKSCSDGYGSSNRNVVDDIAKPQHSLALEMQPLSSSVNPCINKAGDVGGRPIQENIEVAVPDNRSFEKPHSEVDGSSKDVTAIISRPRDKRRRSFTSSLVERSEVLNECVHSAEKEPLPNIDDDTNQLEVAEYVDDIYQFYWVMEASSSSLENYMTIQTDITPKLRSILVNWLIEVHQKFELNPETLYLMAELLDRFLSMHAIEKADMQLVGLTALLLASKYEDFWHPKVKDLISISVDFYTREQMLAMEKFILNKLKFRLNAPTPYVFMRRFLKAAQADAKLEHLAFYLIELCLVEYEALKFKPSLLCASAIYVAQCTLHKTPAWTRLLKKHARYEEFQLRACAEMILRFQRDANMNVLQVSYDKYRSSECSCVATIKPIERLPYVI